MPRRIPSGAAGSGVEVLTTISQTDLDSMEWKLRQFPRKLARKLSASAAREAAKAVMKRAAQLVPHDFGMLEASITVKALKRSRRNKNIAGARVVTGEGTGFFKGDTYYGGFIEYGTKRQPQQSFLRHAAALEKHNVRRIWMRVLKQKITAAANELRAL